MSIHEKTTNRSVGPRCEDPGEDQRLTDVLRARFEESPYASIRALRCSVHEGVAVIDGRLPSFYLRQIAQTIVLSLREIRRLDDRIEVSGRA